MRNVLSTALFSLASLFVSGAAFASESTEENCQAKNRRFNFQQDCEERKASAKQLIQDVANIKVGDVGLVQPKNASCFEPNFCGAQFLSVPASWRADILYCYIKPEKKLQAIIRVGEDVVAKVLEATKEECPQVLMTQVEFVELKAYNAVEVRRLAEQQERIKATIDRVKAARAALDATSR